MCIEFYLKFIEETKQNKKNYFLCGAQKVQLNVCCRISYVLSSLPVVFL